MSKPYQPGYWSARLNRWLRRGPPKHYRGPEIPAILRVLDSLLEGDEEDWRAAPWLKEVYFHPTRPDPSPAMTAQAEGVRAGEFRVSGGYPVQRLGLPPDWSGERNADNNWHFNLHSLEWLAALFHAHTAEPEGGYLEAAAGGSGGHGQCGGRL